MYMQELLEYEPTTIEYAVKFSNAFEYQLFSKAA